MTSVISVLKEAQKGLVQKGVLDGKRTAQELLAHALKCKPGALFLHSERILTQEELGRFDASIRRALRSEPLAYILGEVEFYGCSIKVGRSVLIPRQESEIMLDLALCRLKKEPFEARVAWDICCGSGCLGLALKRALPKLDVTLSDLCPDALALARANAAQNRLQLSFEQGDLLKPFVGRRADLIFCNPPYISSEEWDGLDATVKGFEPKKALVSGPSGFEFYERLAKELPPFLRPEAKIFLEIGASQGEGVNQIFSHPFWRRKELLKDWAGKDRFFFLEAE